NQLVKQSVRTGSSPTQQYTTASYERDVWGEVTGAVTPQSTVTCEYDRLGRVRKQTFVDATAKMPDDSAPTDGTHYREFGYDAAGNRVLVRDVSRPRISTGPETSKWHTEMRADETWSVYDPMNRVVATYDPGNRSTVYKLDTLGRVVEKQDRNY